MFEIEQESFPQREERVLAIWQQLKIFQKSLEKNREGPLFSFYDGPPFATGLPHYGHILAGTIKDVVPRYMAMKGYFVPRRFGWDCHGLPVENEIEKAYELSGAPSIEAFGVAKFNEECRKIVLRYTEQWVQTVNRMGRWVDFDQTYRTMDLSFMESVWWAFGQLYARGLVYEGFKVMPFSAKLGTPISNFEANLNYRDIDDPSLTVMFPLVEDPNTFFLAWTTTPWSLPANLALMVSPTLTCVKVEEVSSGKRYLLAKSRVSHYFKDREVKEIARYKGSELEGKPYLPLFPYFSVRSEQRAFRVILEESVNEEEGSGVVSTAPAFGEVDFFACARSGIEVVCPLDQNGKFTQEAPEFAGMFFKDAEKEIIRHLKAAGRVFHHGQVRHRYPFCWRSDTPLIYKAVRTWFVAVEKIKEKMIAANEEVYWFPEHIKSGRFGKWLENARDWAVSRNRYWGTPIPLWRSADGECMVISSIQELEEKTGKKIGDLHRHYIDDLTFEDHGKIFRRIPEVFDCWFDAGSMPYSQNHFPFENREETLRAFPADFIAEGLDQTRGWFYTLMVLSVALFNRPAFKHVVVNGIILAEDGTKMSKRLKNYPEPERIFNEYGADALRLYLLNSPVVAGEDLKFTERGVELVLRQALLPFWNSYVFFATYAKIYKWTPKEQNSGLPRADIDRWILSLVEKLILDVTRAMQYYDLQRAVAPFVQFIDRLTNWYIRRSRPRFWSEIDSTDRREAFSTLYCVLIALAKISAPFIPFLSDAIFLELKSSQDPESVHLTDYPLSDPSRRDEELEQQMDLVLEAVSAAHMLRKEHQVKVRQPLPVLHIASSEEVVLNILKRQEKLIADEVNVKEVLFHREESSFVTLSAKANFRILGKRVGNKMNAVAQAIQNLDQKQLKLFLQKREVIVTIEGEQVVLSVEDLILERKVKEGLAAATTEHLAIALDLTLSDALLEEGLAREIVNKVNTMRLEEGYQVVDRIEVTLQTGERVKRAFEQFRAYICHEILAEKVHFGACEEGSEWDLNGEKAKIAIKKID